MLASVATIRVARDFDVPVETLFAHWIDPAARQRWEAGPDTGMTYDAFDTREGGVETVRIHDAGGTEIGRLVQHHHRIEENRLIASSMTGVFGGAVTMMTALVVEFRPTDTGSRIEAVAQATDLTGRDIAARQEAGWAWILDRFEADLAAYGPDRGAAAGADTPTDIPKEAS